uniref:CSON015347 protein n=1 Tax=Culicoides sonorensis TaxID=179676 RepID=A0A336MD94_CULSO
MSIDSENLESIYENVYVLVIVEGDILKWVKCLCVTIEKCNPNNLVYLLRVTIILTFILL